MFIEYPFNLGVEEPWVTTLILQPDPHIAPELIVLREHSYHRDFEKSLISIAVHEVVVQHTVLVGANIMEIL